MGRSLRKTLVRLRELPYGLSPWVLHQLRSRRRGFHRENYLYCVERAANEAVALGHRQMSVIEFGVAGGNGLVELERICRYLEMRLPIEFSIFGFDNGEGLPQPVDYRDAPFKWSAGDYVMERAVLDDVLTRSQLVIGDIGVTVPTFFREHAPAPVGAIMFDLDYYSSTVKALQLLLAPVEFLLPRVHCFFDDLGVIPSLGVPLAIAEFNAAHTSLRLEQNRRTVYATNPYIRGWKVYEFHNFSHPDYERPLTRSQQAPLLD